MRHAPHARPPTPRPSREYGPRDAPRPRGDVRRARPSHRGVTEGPADPGSLARTPGRTAREAHRSGGGRAVARAPVLARQGTGAYVQPTPIEIPSVKRHSVSSPVRCFLRLPYGPVQLSLRPSRCCSAFCSRCGVGRDGPGACGWYEGADGANYPTTSMWCVLSQGISRARRSRFSQLDSRTVLPCYPARLYSVFARGRSCCASYGTPSRHIA